MCQGGLAGEDLEDLGMGGSTPALPGRVSSTAPCVQYMQYMQYMQTLSRLAQRLSQYQQPLTINSRAQQNPPHQ
jgi:hypothetical protein